MTLLNAFVIAQNEATCTLNGEQVPCDELSDVFGGFLAGFSILFILFILFGILTVAFTIWMIIDAAQRDFDDKLVWIILMVFTGLIGAVAYYFAVKRKSSNDVISENPPSPTSHASETAPQRPQQNNEKQNGNK